MVGLRSRWNERALMLNSNAARVVAPVDETEAPVVGAPSEPPRTPHFDQVYQRYVDFVWRSVRRLGVDDGAVDDVVQQVFMVVYRRLPEFSHASTIRTWIFGIMLRVLREHR